MRIYAGVSALSGRPYAGLGCGFSIRGHGRAATRRTTTERLGLLHDRAIESEHIAEAAYHAAALRGLKGLDAMLAELDRQQDFVS